MEINNFTYCCPKFVIDTYNIFNSLSPIDKCKCIALSILSGLFFIIPGILVFRFSVVKLHEWDQESKKQTAEKTLAVGEYPIADKVDRKTLAALMRVISAIYNLEETIMKT